jgi:hypothetical protein
VNCRRLRSRSVIVAVGIALAALALGGCFRRPLLSASHDRPPQVLMPARAAGIPDGRARFREIWCAVRNDHGKDLPEDRPCDDALLRLEGEGAPTGRPVALGHAQRALRVVVVPGIFAECVQRLASPFSDALAHIETHGYRTAVIRVGGRSSSQHNAEQIRRAILGMTLDAGERLLLVGHSKGAVDILEALVTFPEIVNRIAAVASVAGAINGSPLADGLRAFYVGMLQQLPLQGCDRDDGGLDSLRRTERLKFLAENPLPSSVRYLSLGGIATPHETSRLLRPASGRLADVDPLNDGQVLWSDTVIPGATLLGYVRADHWALAMPFSRTSPALAATLIDHNAFPREVLLEAIVRTVDESL